MKSANLLSLLCHTWCLPPTLGTTVFLDLIVKAGPKKQKPFPFSWLLLWLGFI